jgi:hypothetical protein
VVSRGWIAPYNPLEDDFADADEKADLEAQLADYRQRFDRARDALEFSKVDMLGAKEHRCPDAAVHVPGRTQLSAFFGKSGLFEKPSWHHHQALAFIVQGQLVSVRICGTLEALLKLPDETPVMQQWPGKWDSDWFTYTVGDVRGYLGAEDDKP